MYSELYNHRQICFRTFLSPHEEALYPSAVPPQPPSHPQPQTIITSFPVSMDLPVLDVLYKRNPA